MRKKVLLMMLLMALFAPLAMHAQGLTKAPRGTALQAITTQNCEKHSAIQTRDAGWLQYDDGSYLGATGASQAYLWTYGPMYPASMLGNNNTLSKVAFYENSSMIAYYGVTIDIYSGGDNEPGSLLYTEAVSLNGTDGMHEVEFATPVTIDPTQNLWITITVAGTSVLCLANSNESINNNWIDNGGWVHLSDLIPSYSAYGWMIRGYVEYIDPSTCPKPTQLTASNITTNSATLSWNGEASSYQLVYSDREGFDPDSATPINVTETSYSLTNLTDGTTYYAYVRSNCEGSYSVWSSIASFTTISACATPYNVTVSNITTNSADITWNGWQSSYSLRYTVPAFFDNFENGLDNWTIVTAGEAPQENGWYTINPTSGLQIDAHSGNYVASAWSWNNNTAYNADNWLITPQIELGGTLSFWVYTNPSYPDSYEVRLSTEGNETTDFTTTLQEMAPAPTTGEWSEVSIDLSSYSGTGYIAIRHMTLDMNYLLVDDFLVESPGATWTALSKVTSPYTLLDLNDGTQYVFQIQGNCPSGTTEWTNIASFTTLLPCPTPTDLFIDETSITTNGATVKWVSDAASFDVELDGVTIAEGITETAYTLDNLDPGTYYEVKVRANCGETGYSGWTTAVSFNTACESYDIPYTYGFDDVLTTNSPDYICWYKYSWNSVNSPSLVYRNQEQGDVMFRFSSYNEIEDEENESYDQILISPELNAETAVSVSFEYRAATTNYGYESFMVGYSFDGISFNWGDVIEVKNVSEWAVYSDIFPVGTKYVAVYYLSEWLTYLFLDNFSFEIGKAFVTDGNWNEADNWSPTGVPTSEENALIEAEATITDVTYVDVVRLGENGSITIEDGGQLYHSTNGLEVTMKKNITAYTDANGTDNYHLLAFPFNEYVEVPTTMTAAEGNDFYMFDNNKVEEEWQNNQTVAIEEVAAFYGYLYANPDAMELSLTGSTYATNGNEGYIHLTYDNGNTVNGWYLLGNPFIVDAYIYNVIFDEDNNITDIIPMNAMYYDENGDMQTISGGPVAPMQGFFVNITEDSHIFFLTYSLDDSLKSLKKSGNTVTVPTKKVSSIESERVFQAIPTQTKLVKTAPILIIHDKDLPIKK